MAIAMLVDNPEGSQEIYEKVRAQLGLEAPAGGIFHAAGPSPTGAGGCSKSGSRRRMQGDSETSA